VGRGGGCDGEGHGGDHGEEGCGGEGRRGGRRSCRELTGPGQAPSAVGARRAAAPSGSTPPVKCPYRGVWKSWFVQLSLPISSLFRGASFSYYPFCPRPLPPARLSRWARLSQMWLSGRLQGRLLSVSLGPTKESVRMWWSLRGSWRWRRSWCQRWYRRRRQRRGPRSPSAQRWLLHHLVVREHHFHHCLTGPWPWGLPPAREWRWSRGIHPLCAG
jgi:hypothetical protein